MKKFSQSKRNILSYWCFCPGFSMQELVRQGVRSIILTSGTLSPLCSFTSEMQIPFPVCLENPHVIQRDQIFVTIVDKGPEGVQLSSSYDRRQVKATEHDIWQTHTVGGLSFTAPPSYTYTPAPLFQPLNRDPVPGCVRNRDPVPGCVSLGHSQNEEDVIDGYYNKVNDPKLKGGSFFAVCRGKASEGLDFSDTYGRGVVITGLPFPPRMDPRVILKMQYLDEMCRKAAGGAKYLSGQNWYRQQASRAVNQAIGRVIRHRDDYGAIFLCDHRPYVRTHDNFGNVVRDVAQFFRVAQKLGALPDRTAPTGRQPPPQKKPVEAGCGAVCSLETSPSWGGSCSLSQSPFSPIQKAKALDPHIPSLKKRRLNRHTVGEGVPGLCAQYGAEMDNSSRKPAGLLDALAASDRKSSEAGEEQIPGEEKLYSPPSLCHPCLGCLLLVFGPFWFWDITGSLSLSQSVFL
ncbi:hypothetical protein JZ751_019913 [Albula glossodonta]|uniref:ATP-dependent helicase C-terminal domain-containing protein n=1 Tax=Albula glossodonta TaxID=121402 RepID=A0A8T2MS48_9TELE|nr:hypothetical protein JZ751_019913 [Albula glossodonta]